MLNPHNPTESINTPHWKGSLSITEPDTTVSHPQAALGSAQSFHIPPGVHPNGTTHGFTDSLQRGECSVPAGAIFNQSQHASSPDGHILLESTRHNPSDGDPGWSGSPSIACIPLRFLFAGATQGAAAMMRDEENKVPDFSTRL